jgi:hypothetical protein
MNFNYKLIEVCIGQAKSLLEEFREFYPFAFAMEKDLTIVPVMTYSGDEFPSSKTVVEELEKALKISSEHHNYVGVAICSDGTFNKADALQIRVDFLDDATIDIYEMYTISDENVFSIQDEILEKGTFLFF